MKTIKELITKMIKDCRNMQLNVCDECPSKKECCQIAFESYQSYKPV